MMDKMTYFREGDVLYMGMVGVDGKKLTCRQIKVYKREGLIRKAGYTDPLGHRYEEECFFQRIYDNKNGSHFDVPVEGEEVSIGYDRERIIQTLRDLKISYPIYYMSIEGKEELVLNEESKV